MYSRKHFSALDRRSFLAVAASGAAGLTLGRALAQGGTASVISRKSAAKAETDPAEIQVIRDAVAILKAKDGAAPAADGWIAIADPHIGSCFTGDSREIHFGWWFLPWHRAYLLAMERRLQYVVSEPKLRLPYWNWFEVDAIPEAFARKTYVSASGNERENPLFDATRAKGPAERSAKFLGDNGRRITRVVLSNFDSELDLLRPRRFADVGGRKPSGRQAPGAIEQGPHNNIHVWVGGTHDVLPGRNGQGGNMGQEFSPRDPVFLLHHGNIDRLWTVWSNLLIGGARQNPTDQEWLKQTFPMPHHTGVGVETYTVGELLDTSAFGYLYDREEIEVVVAATAGGVSQPSGSPSSYKMNDTPLDLSSGTARTPIRLQIAGPAAAAVTVSQSGILRLTGVIVPRGTVALSVYINAPKLQENTETNLVGISTILDPTGKPGDGTRELDIVIPVSERVLKLINEQPEYALSVVAGPPGVAAPAPAAASIFAGASIREIRLDIE